MVKGGTGTGVDVAEHRQAGRYHSIPGALVITLVGLSPVTWSCPFMYSIAIVLPARVMNREVDRGRAIEHGEFPRC